MLALSACEGQIVTVVARPEQTLDVAAGAPVSAQAAHALRRDGITLNLINVGKGAVNPVRAAVVGLLAKSFGSLRGTELRL